MTDEMEFDDLTDPTVPDQQNETPRLDEVLLDAMKDFILDIHVAMPAQIVNVRGNQNIDVQPLLQSKYGTLVTIPVIQNVPVMMPSGADYALKLPIAVGDTGQLVFNERSIDKWKVSGGTVDPNDARTHDLSDAVFYPGLNPFSSQVKGAATDMILVNGSAKLTLKKAGTFAATNGSNELIDLLVQTLTALTKVTTNTMLGPEMFVNVADFTAILSKLTSLKG
jgi:hypothetical protein